MLCAEPLTERPQDAVRTLERGADPANEHDTPNAESRRRKRLDQVPSRTEELANPARTPIPR
jgi:hypothetical protein